MTKEVKCDKCEGKGWVNNIAKSYLKFALFNIPSRPTKDCDKCNGSGIIKYTD